ncbi:beta strand repeat-containing protein [uncultured Jatrophihabitans sp.]|uniref:beta strand repeat-containing protein n=1 Tax=uncultured Jatrophihabitans sp. TaxID=1610747 RepID=UPI0035C97623
MPTLKLFMLRWVVVASLALLSMVFVAAPAALAAPPANDAFSSSVTLAGGAGSASGTNVDATKETGEPNHAGNVGGKSIWYRWVAPSSGTITFNTFGSGFDTLLAAYTGSSVSALTAIAANDDAVAGSAGESRTSFAAVSGTAYLIAVDGYSGASGNVTLSWEPPPANDAFATPIQLSGVSGSISGSNTGATKEASEPDHAGVAGGSSLWYRWIAPNSGTVSFDTLPSGFNTLLAVYIGQSVDSLTSIASNNDVSADSTRSRVSFSATAGSVYRIAVDGAGRASGSVVLNWAGPAQANDAFAAATVISGASGNVGGTNAGATKETNEPSHAGNPGGKSIWYQWTAPSSGTVSFDTRTSSFNTLLAVYTGNAVNALTLVAGNDDLATGTVQSQLTFFANAGTVYRIAIDGFNAAQGSTSLTWGPPPANDAFATPTVVSGASGTSAGSNAGATKETGEPQHAGNAGGASIWYQWTAPSAAAVSFDTLTSNVDTLLAVYTGSAVNNLTLVSSNDDAAAGLRQSQTTFTPTSGTVYSIAVDGYNGAAGPITLRWGAPPPANDLFASAKPIFGGAGSVSGTNSTATKESGEPNHAGNAGGKSVWYSWTAPGNGTFTFKTAGSSFDTLLAVYTGSSVSALTSIASNDDSGSVQTSKASFTAVLGTVYRIAVDGKSGAAGKITLAWSAPAPANDNFAAARVLSGRGGAVSDSNVNATREAGEPQHAGEDGSTSVWYRWTAPTTGNYTFETTGSSFDTLLAVYTGAAVGSLTPIVSNDDADATVSTSRVTLAATAGTVYSIAVDGYQSDFGAIILTWTPPAPANDAFASATTVTGASGTSSGTNLDASKEAGEPDHAGTPGGKSVWYSWTAPSTGNFSFATTGSDFDTVLAAYVGTAVNGLMPVAADDDDGSLNTSQVIIAATSGTVYSIAVDGYGGASGAISLSWTPTPSNDAFATPVALPATSGSVSGTNVGASKESGEPDHANEPGGHSVWFQWTAPSNKSVSFDTLGSAFDTVLAVYTGSSVDNLTEVVSNDDAAGAGLPQSRVSFVPTAGAVYSVAVDGANRATGAVKVTVTPAPANDAFAAPKLISGASGSSTGSNVAASKEPGEPNHAGQPGGSSVWYRWTAPSSGLATFDTLTSKIDTLLGVYTGSAVGALTTIASNDDVSGSVTQSQLTFAATSGKVYYIAVDGYARQAGAIALHWSLAPTPATTLAYDDFQRSVTSGWGAADVGGSWSVSPSASFGVSGGAGTIALGAGVSGSAALGSTSSITNDTSVSFALDKAPTGLGYTFSVVGRRISGQGGYRTKVLVSSTGAVSIQLNRYNTTGTTSLGSASTVSGLTYTAGTQLRVRMQTVGVNPTQITAKVWSTTGAEPTTWKVSASDSTPELQAAGNPSINPSYASNATNAPITASVDTLRVTTQLAADDFGRSTSSGWGTADVGGSWTTSPAASAAVAGGVGRMSLGAGATVNAYFSQFALQTDAAVTFSLDKKPTGGGTSFTLAGRRISGQGAYRAKVLVAPSGAVSIQLIRYTTSDAVLTSATTISGLTYTAGTPLRVRLQTLGSGTTTLNAKVWAASAAEPADWQVSATDTTAGLQAQGTVAISSTNSSSSTNAPITVSVDNLRVNLPS